MGDAEWHPTSEKTSIYSCRSAKTKTASDHWSVYSFDFTGVHLVHSSGVDMLTTPVFNHPLFSPDVII